jgi:hypothetical protein
LCRLVRARAALDEEDRETAQRAAHEGLHLARACGLGLYHIELLCLQGEINLARGDAPAAEHLAREAVGRAVAVDCRFAWGEAESWHLLGKSLAVQGRLRKARAALGAARELRRRIGDPRLDETARLLISVGG